MTSFRIAMEASPASRSSLSFVGEPRAALSVGALWRPSAAKAMASTKVVGYGAATAVHFTSLPAHGVEPLSSWCLQVQLHRKPSFGGIQWFHQLVDFRH